MTSWTESSIAQECVKVAAALSDILHITRIRKMELVVAIPHLVLAQLEAIKPGEKAQSTFFASKPSLEKSF